MSENIEPNKILEFDSKSADETLAELMEVLQKYKLTAGELTIVYGNLGYIIGASIAGYTDKGPDLEELKKLYYSKPGDLGISLALAGMTITSWYETYQEQMIKK